MAKSLNPSNRPEAKIKRNGKPPIYSDNLAEVSLNANVCLMTFGYRDIKSNDPTYTESVTVSIPTIEFIHAVREVMLPIINNPELLNYLQQEYIRYNALTEEFSRNLNKEK